MTAKRVWQFIRSKQCRRKHLLVIVGLFIYILFSYTIDPSKLTEQIDNNATSDIPGESVYDFYSIS